VPKLVSRGEKIGQSDLVRRENLTLFPLVPAAMLEVQAELPSAEEVAAANPAKAKTNKMSDSEIVGFMGVAVETADIEG
jgi:hypothetical protein